MLTAPQIEHTAMMRSVAQRRTGEHTATKTLPEPMPKRASPMTR